MSFRIAGCLASLVLTSTALAQWPGAVPPPQELRPGFDSIDVSESRAMLDIIAGPVFQGRGTGQVGYTMAAAWVAGKYAEWGLQPTDPTGSYFHDVPFVRISAGSESSIRIGDTTVSLGDGLGFSSLASDVDTTAEIAFVTVGSNMDELPDSIDVEGKHLVVAGEPSQAFLRSAFQARPVSYVRVVDEVSSASSVRPAFTQGRRGATRPTLSQDAFFRLAGAAGLEVRASVDPTEIFSATNDREATLTVELEQEEFGIPNVVGVLPGSDPELADEMVVICGHLDHLGIRGGEVYYGADDNGSGMVTLLQTAKALSMNPVKPKRSVMFIAWAAEEIGLLGSRYYADNPAIPLDRKVALIQLDMIGRDEETDTDRPEDNRRTIHPVGLRRQSSELEPLIQEANRYVGFEFEYDEERVFTRSDHYPFVQKGVLAMFFFGGFNPDYHTTRDTIDKINFEKVANLARLNYIAAHLIGNHEGSFSQDLVASD